MPPTVIFGDIRGLNLDELLPVLSKYGINRLDSAAVYERGESERRLGEAEIGKRFTIDTKILTGQSRDGTLKPDKIELSSRISLERLKTDKINVLYCHAPDDQTPILEQARAFDEIQRQGRFDALGLSNFKPEMVEDWVKIAKSEGYVRPTWYQGQYNLLCRTLESILFPLLRTEGIRFAAYSPLGGGFLNGNLTPQRAIGTRFVSHAARQMYLGSYDRPVMHDAFAKLQHISDKTNVSTAELSLRWLMHHSKLEDDDVVILGASKISQAEESLGLLRKGPLDGKIAAELDALWTEEAEAVGLEMIKP